MSSSYGDRAADASWPNASGPLEEPAEVVDDEPLFAPTLLVPVPDHVTADEPEPEIPMPATPESPPVDDGIDALTGLPDATAFSRLVADEDARIARYHRAATVVIFELEGLDRLVERLGDEAGDRIVPAVADTLRRLARAADHVARLGPGRFGALLPETDEVAAINYIERVRKACDLWLETGAIAMRLAIGWAGTAGDPPLPTRSAPPPSGCTRSCAVGHASRDRRRCPAGRAARQPPYRQPRLRLPLRHPRRRPAPPTRLT